MTDLLERLQALADSGIVDIDHDVTGLAKEAVEVIEAREFECEYWKDIVFRVMECIPQ